jgi:hypothetical protein
MGVNLSDKGLIFDLPLESLVLVVATPLRNAPSRFPLQLDMVAIGSCRYMLISLSCSMSDLVFEFSVLVAFHSYFPTPRGPMW